MASRLIYVNLEVGHGFTSSAFGRCLVCPIPSFFRCYFLKEKKNRNLEMEERVRPSDIVEKMTLAISLHQLIEKEGEKSFYFYQVGRILNTAC